MSPIDKQIVPDPLVLTALEIRFTSDIKQEDTITVFHPLFSTKFPIISQRPIAFNISLSGKQPVQQPPTYQFIDTVNSMTVIVGNNIITIEPIGNYPGWEDYFRVIKESLLELAKLNRIKSIERVGLRYAGVFETSKTIIGTFDLGHFKLEGYKENIKFIQTEMMGQENIKLLLQVSDSAKVSKNGIDKTGTYIDIDASIVADIPQVIDDTLFGIIDKLHSEEKKLFSTAINKDFLATLETK